MTQQNLNVEKDLDLSNFFDIIKKDILINLNCHHIGIVQSFNSSTQRAQVKIVYNKTLQVLNWNGYELQNVSYPIMADCPVIVLGGGLTSLTFPITIGDECLVLFNDRDIDNWISNSVTLEVNSSRLHSFSDGIILVGLRSALNVVKNYSSTDAVLQNGTTNVSVGIAKITIQNQIDTLGNIINDLLTAIKGITTLATDHTNGFVSAASQLQLTTIATRLQGLLG